MLFILGNSEDFQWWTYRTAHYAPKLETGDGLLTRVVSFLRESSSMEIEDPFCRFRKILFAL
jgi:hypothetical protein